MSWVNLEYFRLLSRPRPHDFRAGVVEIFLGVLDAGTIDAWNSGRGDAIERGFRFELERFGCVPEGFEILSVWDDPRRRLACLVVAHPKMDLVREGHETPVVARVDSSGSVFGAFSEGNQ